MCCRTVTITTEQGGHRIRFNGGVFTQWEAVEAARVLGNLNAALSGGYPYSPCRTLLILNWRGGKR